MPTSQISLCEMLLFLPPDPSSVSLGSCALATPRAPSACRPLWAPHHRATETVLSAPQSGTHRSRVPCAHGSCGLHTQPTLPSTVPQLSWDQASHEAKQLPCSAPGAALQCLSSLIAWPRGCSGTIRSRDIVTYWCKRSVFLSIHTFLSDQQSS